jgi:hypothetical protein
MKNRRRRPGAIGGPCKTEFDYIGWIRQGNWRRAVLNDNDELTPHTSLVSRPIKGDHSCWTHCDSPGQCRYQNVRQKKQDSANDQPKDAMNLLEVEDVEMSDSSSASEWDFESGESESVSKPPTGTSTVSHDEDLDIDGDYDFWSDDSSILHSGSTEINTAVMALSPLPSTVLEMGLGDPTMFNNTSQDFVIWDDGEDDTMDGPTNVYPTEEEDLEVEDQKILEDLGRISTAFMKGEY